MRDERRMEERSKQGQTNNKAKQHSTPKAVTSPKKNELPRVGLEPTTLYTLDRALYTTYTLLASFFLPSASLINMCIVDYKPTVSEHSTPDL